MVNWKALVAEFIGTFTLVFVGSAAVWFAKTTPGYAAGPLIPALAHGFAVVFAAYALGKISGAHLNPAVTTAIAIAGGIDWVKAAFYIVTQIVAALVAALLLNALLLPAAPSGAAVAAANFFGAFSYNTAVTTSIGALFTEAILTFFLAFAVVMGAVYGKAGDLAGLVIGLTLVMAIVAGGGISEASLNPARSIGPALVAGKLDNIWIYIIGPVLGAAAAAAVVRYVFDPNAPPKTPPTRNTGRR
ncbi:MAG: aquaporin [Thermoflexales bacterium]|nr:aquaporin [Thermoflexales bacterium]MDW8352013.1 aquaporin [Anaerolineae bacterium]